MMSLTLQKIPKVTYTYSVDVGGESFQPCELLAMLIAVKTFPSELWNISQKRLDALARLNILIDPKPKMLAVTGPKIDDYIDELTQMVVTDSDLESLWQRRYAERYHTGALAQK